MRQCPYLITGLQQASFTGGWLNDMQEKTGKQPKYTK
jgi:hypothetical protein